MASGWTNKGRYKCVGVWLHGVAAEALLYMALLDDATSPSATTNTMSDHTEIAAGNGYTSGGGTAGEITPGTETDEWYEDDGSNFGRVQITDRVWTASGGSIPSDYPTTVAQWAVLTDDNGTVSAREIYVWFDLVSGRTVSDGQSLTIQDAEVRIA